MAISMISSPMAVSTLPSMMPMGGQKKPPTMRIRLRIRVIVKIFIDLLFSV